MGLGMKGMGRLSPKRRGGSRVLWASSWVGLDWRVCRRVQLISSMVQHREGRNGREPQVGNQANEHLGCIGDFLVQIHGPVPTA